MKSYSLSFHEECLKNRKENYVTREAAVKVAVEALERARRDIAILEAQIARAKAEGKTTFNRDRYNIPRKP
jgi:uncharacterized small protein (DUF1192 family)